jgi:hypothetical protein
VNPFLSDQRYTQNILSVSEKKLKADKELKGVAQPWDPIWYDRDILGSAYMLSSEGVAQAGKGASENAN